MGGNNGGNIDFRKAFCNPCKIKSCDIDGLGLRRVFCKVRSRLVQEKHCRVTFSDRTGKRWPGTVGILLLEIVKLDDDKNSEKIGTTYMAFI